jgi:hypothetical protein
MISGPATWWAKNTKFHLLWLHVHPSLIRHHCTSHWAWGGHSMLEDESRRIFMKFKHNPLNQQIMSSSRRREKEDVQFIAKWYKIHWLLGSFIHASRTDKDFLSGCGWISRLRKMASSLKPSRANRVILFQLDFEGHSWNLICLCLSFGFTAYVNCSLYVSFRR